MKAVATIEPNVSGWDKSDLREFDRIITKCDSLRQMDRILGRSEWSEFEKRFTKEQLDDMWRFIKW